MNQKQDTQPLPPISRKAQLSAPLVLLGLVLVSTVSVASSSPRGGQFEDEVFVQEVSVVVDVADIASRPDSDRLEMGDVAVLEDGSLRVVTRIEPVPRILPAEDETAFEDVTECPWTFLIYFDAVLADPATVFEGALALGQQSESLTELGCVGIVTADPIPEVVVSSSRSPEYVEKVLVDLAAVARVERDRSPIQTKRPPAGTNRDVSEIEAQWDRLIGFVASRRSAGPKALFLISDGFALSTMDIEALSGRLRPELRLPGDRPLADVVADAAQTLSSYGWQTIAMPLVHGRELPPLTPSRVNTWDEVEGRTVSGDRRNVVNFFGRTRANRPTGGLDNRLYEAYLLPTLAPLRALAEATSGEVVWSQSQLAEILEKLGQRRLVWFQTPEPHDGRIRRLHIYLVDTGAYLEAPWWKRSSTPDLVAETRLRRLLAGETSNSALAVSAEVVHAGAKIGGALPHSMLRVRVSPAAFGDRLSIGHVRISVGFAGSDEIRSFEHVIDYDAPPLGGEWTHSLSLEVPSGTMSLAVGVEDLSLEEWGATVVRLPSDEGGQLPEDTQDSEDDPRSIQ